MDGYSIMRQRKRDALGTGYKLRARETKRYLDFFLSRCIYKHTGMKNET